MEGDSDVKTHVHRHTDVRDKVTPDVMIQNNSYVGVCCSGSTNGRIQVNESKGTRDYVTQNTSLSLEYGVEDNPPLHMTVLFGLQQVLLAISSTITIPLIVSDKICAGDLDLVKSEIMSTFLFMCGVCTILQDIFGVRLPILQGGCHKFLPAITALMALEKWQCPDFILKTENVTLDETWSNNRTEIWQSRMREIQGGIIIASITQVVIGCTGLLGMILQFVGPLTVVPTITLVGLSLIDVALSFCEKHWGISFLTIILVFIFSLYLRNIKVPLPTFSLSDGCYKTRYSVFKLLPVILAVVISWGVCGILTVTDVLSRDKSLPEFKARTDARTDVLQISKWFFFPYPGQWGIPTISIAGVMAMFAATIASIIESVGDYYACARISGVPSPPAHAINRGIAMEGFGSIISGFVGSGGATTSYSQNVGAIGFTKVASRRVFVCAGIIFFLCGIFGKFGAALTMLPDPILGGVVVISFGMVTAVGISTLQFVDLSSGRNLCIIGSSLIIGLMVPKYMVQNKNAINTGIIELDQVITVLLSTAMFVGGVLGFILDNTVPGTDEERGILKWRNQMVLGNKSELLSSKVYDLPYITPFLFRYKCFRYIPFLPTFKLQPVLTCCKKEDKSLADSQNENRAYYDDVIENKSNCGVDNEAMENKSNCDVVGTKSFGELSTVTEVTSL